MASKAEDVKGFKSSKGSKTSGSWNQGSEGQRVQGIWEHILGHPQGKKGLKGQYLQDLQGLKGSMFTLPIA